MIQAIRKWLPRRQSFLNTEIPRVCAALKRHQSRLNEMSAESRGDCCPACRFGAQWRVAETKAERTASWLCVLLRKRGQPEDMRLSKAIEMGAWP